MSKKRSYDTIKQIINDSLEKYGQQTRIIEMRKSKIVLSNGTVLSSHKDITEIKRRLMCDHSLWLENFDNLLSGKITPKEIKSKLGVIGGINCQKLHGEAIKKNLNQGTPWNKGVTGVIKHGPMSDETKRKISSANSGKGNGMYGKSLTVEEKAHKSKVMKQKILDGEFTPNANNRRSRLRDEYRGRKYRSSWEALYQYFNQNAEYEKLRIRYEINGEYHIYIVDFINEYSRVVTEIKPTELCCGREFDAKMAALDQWCSENKYTKEVVGIEWFLSKEPPSDFDDFNENAAGKIKRLYEAAKKN
jgi:hypothetical protein